ncbi:MAG: MBL fold metallo-hydrolase [Candidatus Omnitrophica bacterium]|nr:MBL fold metallo-hydrolase [Candidatus Omnitrophota bacterium]
MQVRVIAVGSTKWERFIRRWGVSFLIGEDVLFDTFGDARVFLRNIRKFNIDIDKIKHVVISHDDWDHVTGLWHLLNNRKDITVYICPRFNAQIKERIYSFGVKVIEVSDSTLIKDGVYSTGELYGESEGRQIYEQSLVIETMHGLSVICGCAHPGVANIVRDAKEGFQTKVYSLVGGFHLKDNTDEANRNIIKKLQELGVRRVAPMHCTGQRATYAMREVFGNDFIQAKVGSSIEI